MKYFVTIKDIKVYDLTLSINTNGIQLDKNMVDLYKSAVNLITTINKQIEMK
jgi:hypothetical protein